MSQQLKNRPFQDIPGAQDWELIEKIEAGWSHDLKYYIQDQSGSQFLLRISDQKDLLEERHLYHSFQNLPKLSSHFPQLIKEGYCNKNQGTYRLFSWIAGVPALDKIASFTPEQCYHLGLQAGRLLKHIHAAPVEEQHLVDWVAYYQAKIDRKLDAYAKCHLKYDKGEALIDFIQQTRHLLAAQKQCFLHGDYHIGNMLITPAEDIAIIDFNRLEYADPWAEFNRINWTAQASPLLAKGQIEAYFDFSIPETFFHWMALFIAVNQIGALPWAMDYSEKDVKTIIRQTEEILVWYQDFQQIIPSWHA